MQRISGQSDGCHVVVCHEAGPAGHRVHNLAPDVAAGNNLQLIAGCQTADRLGGLVGLHAQADAVGGLVVQGFREDDIGRNSDKMVVAFGDFVLAGLLFLQELLHDIAADFFIRDINPAIADVFQDPYFGSAVEPGDQFGAGAGLLADIQAVTVRTVDPHFFSEACGVIGESRYHQGQYSNQDNYNAQQFLYGISFLSSPIGRQLFGSASGFSSLTSFVTQQLRKVAVILK